MKIRELQDRLLEKTGKMAESYADLIMKRLQDAMREDSDVKAAEALQQINESIKMMGYLTTAITRMSQKKYPPSDN